MTNDEILQERWQEVDELLSTFYTNNNKINKALYSRLQDIFNGINYKYEDLYRYATANQISNFKNKVTELRYTYELEGYTGYILDNLYKQKKIKNSDILMGLLTIAYYIQYQEQKKLETKLFDEIVNNSYRQGQIEYIETIKSKKLKKEKEARLLTVPEAYLLQLIGMDSFNGYKWYDYKEGNINYYVKQLFQKVAIKLQQNKKIDVYDDDIQKQLKKYERAYLEIKKDDKIEGVTGYRDIFYGALDNEVCFLANMSALDGMKKQGCKKVRFIAVLDNHTTEMCKSLDNQVFKIDGWNTFSRYSDEDKKNIIYRVKGLELGANLPPINNGFHYCRSVIYPER